MYLKSREVARRLGINYWSLVYLLRSDKIKQPNKDASGDLIWSARDVRNAQLALDQIGKRDARKKEPSQA